MSDAQNIYDTITNKIIADLEKGILAWRKPWHSDTLSSRVIRPLRHNDIPYTGINTIILWMAAMEQGYQSPYWMTFKQAINMKANVKKGEKGTNIVYADKMVRTEQDETGKDVQVTIPYLKAYTVFNANQIEGLPPAYYAQPESKPAPKHERIPSLDSFFANTKATVQDGVQATYFLLRDIIEMPPFDCFIDAPAYYATLAHEVTHWTSHPSRLNRNFNRKAWGDEGYAKEELVAELGACFLNADLGLSPLPDEQHAAYIQSWLKVLKNEKRFIFSAAAHASRAVEYLHALQTETQPTTTTKPTPTLTMTGA
ncbi:MAG: zincin-like metallopeptidase domain-containing protein [Bacteroidia bacterium]|jgi:antirestriction protein ArdC|nr:zincin-like metallopeptidase domain-containing protein [Bacteroidia bacterium]